MMSAKPYVEYLDKEMTIMGILSVFCVSAAALVAKAILDVTGSGSTSAKVSDLLWSHGSIYLLAGAGCLLVAALFFYFQRSLLAWHYGRLCLAEARGEETSDLLDDADSWATWLRYRWGFIFTTLGFAYLAIPFLSLRSIVNSESPRMFIILAGISLVYMIPESVVLTVYNYEEAPWKTFLKKIQKR